MRFTWLARSLQWPTINASRRYIILMNILNDSSSTSSIDSNTDFFYPSRNVPRNVKQPLHIKQSFTLQTFNENNRKKVIISSMNRFIYFYIPFTTKARII